MSFFPEGFDASADVVAVLDLVLIDTPDGEFGFMLGVDGKFTDTEGRVFWGTTLATASELQMSINGTAPAGEIGLSFFQDPDAEDLIAQIKALGVDYIKGRSITFLTQPLTSMEQFFAPVLPPIQVARRVMTQRRTSATGPINRSISVAFEGPFSGRNTASGLLYTTEDHAKLTGSANPSLQFMPRDNFQAQKLFG